MAQRNAKVAASPRCKPEAGVRSLRGWIGRHKLAGMVELSLEGRAMVVRKDETAITRRMDLAGWSVVEPLLQAWEDPLTPLSFYPGGLRRTGSGKRASPPRPPTRQRSECFPG